MTARGTEAGSVGCSRMTRKDLAAAGSVAAIGLAAGLVGTLVMSLGQRAEMGLSGRSSSHTPAKAIEAVSGVDVPDGYQDRVSLWTHLGYGTALGLGLAALAKVPEPARGTIFGTGAWLGGAGLQTALGVNDPPTRWKRAELAIDLLHHAVYAGAAAATFSGLTSLMRPRDD